jgi:hypothetical protein
LSFFQRLFWRYFVHSTGLIGLNISETNFEMTSAYAF